MVGWSLLLTLGKSMMMWERKTYWSWWQPSTIYNEQQCAMWHSEPNITSETALLHDWKSTKQRETCTRIRI